MDINDLRKRKIELERVLTKFINRELDEFYRDTEIEVDAVKVTYYTAYAEDLYIPSHGVTVQCTLSI